ncbi:Pycsar system effector family protein [Streptomyces sp. NBRC 110028]|uniref:Pycsar system effector family protein n=1 Tax=Streptomyces sp. NBRC 110028 TaxID=1621260 RepID=UPI0006E34443|nr:Pycsar system effector family protein [Streptomyces sp. NBRC 110028]
MPTRRGDGDTGNGGQLVRVLITETREELLKADGKAGLMLTALGVALTALLGALSGGGITPQDYPTVPRLLFWSGCAAWVPSLVMLGLAVTPRPGKPRRLRAHYFGDAAETASVRLMAAAVRRTDPMDRDLSQFMTLSRTVSTKYRCIRHGMAWSATFLVLTSLGLLTGTTS